jgi:hypothetical protein
MMGVVNLFYKFKISYRDPEDIVASGSPLYADLGASGIYTWDGNG